MQNVGLKNKSQPYYIYFNELPLGIKLDATRASRWKVGLQVPRGVYTSDQSKLNWIYPKTLDLSSASIEISVEDQLELMTDARKKELGLEDETAANYDSNLSAIYPNTAYVQKASMGNKKKNKSKSKNKNKNNSDNIPQWPLGYDKYRIAQNTGNEYMAKGSDNQQFTLDKFSVRILKFDLWIGTYLEALQRCVPDVACVLVRSLCSDHYEIPPDFISYALLNSPVFETGKKIPLAYLGNLIGAFITGGRGRLMHWYERPDFHVDIYNGRIDFENSNLDLTPFMQDPTAQHFGYCNNR